jgi:uncharacterized Zn finger protein
MSTKAPSSPFAALTWDDVEAWAGSTIVSRGKSYQRSNRVQKLARTANGGILAWVQGTSRYVTHVEIAKKKLTASCTCPYAYGDTCKHAVAVVLSYLEGLKNQKEIPTAAEDDPRFDLLQEAAEAAAAGRAWEPEEGDDEDEDEEDYDDEGDDGDDDEEEDDEDDDEEEDDGEPTVSRRAVAKR